MLNQLSQRSTTKIAGLAYLVIIAMGMFAEFMVRTSLFVEGDPTLTAKNIVESESLFRMSIAADLVMIAFDIVVAIALYVLLRKVSRVLALATTLFRLIQASILGANLLSLVAVTLLLSNSEYLNVFSAEQLNSLAMTFLEIHAVGYSVGLVFFGLGTVVLGYTLSKFNMVPQFLAGLLVMSGFVYIVGSIAAVLAPDQAENMEAAYVIPFVTELTFALWLVFKGFKSRSVASRKAVPVAA
jgi:hypothetical protein